MSKHRSEPTTDIPTNAQAWQIGSALTTGGPSVLTYAETVRAVAGIGQHAGRAREIYAKIPLARPEHLWLYLMQAASLAASIQGLPPESPASDPDTTYESLDDAETTKGAGA